MRLSAHEESSIIWHLCLDVLNMHKGTSLLPNEEVQVPYVVTNMHKGKAWKSSDRRGCAIWGGGGAPSGRS